VRAMHLVRTDSVWLVKLISMLLLLLLLLL
jgi:hypothetical protein